MCLYRPPEYAAISSERASLESKDLGVGSYSVIVSSGLFKRP